MTETLPTHAQTVIIGGGSIGCNTAYHLTKLGMKDVVVLERDQLTSGTTWHAAGLIVAGLLKSEAECEIYTHGRDLYANLEKETGMSTGFRDVGYLQIANNEERVHEMRRLAPFMRRHGINIYEISPKETAELFPIGDLSDVLAGFYIPEDGRANPVDVTMSLAKGARMGGAKIFEGVTVSEIMARNGTATGVRTVDGQTITAENVVICGGMWSRQLGASAGINLPLQAAEHYYLITENVEGLSRDLPVLEDPSTYTYYREEMGGLMLGLFEPGAAPWKLDAIPDDFSFGEIEPDWDRVGPHLELAYSRVPSTLDIGVRKLFCGPESFTPDLAPLVGETPELRNCFVACGMNSLGILNGAGTGKVLAHWIVDGIPPIDVTGINVNRFTKNEATRAFRRDRGPELLGKMFGQHCHNESFNTARNVKRSALYDRLKSRGAFFSESHSWELADWFAPTPEEAKIKEYSWSRQNWFNWHAEEHRAAREEVIVMDMSSMSKFLVQGRDACALMGRLSCNEVDVEPGRVVYTAWVNEKGGFEADLTVTRLEQDKYLVVVGENSHGHTEMRMRRHIGAEEFVTITDITPGITQINVHGPNARELMQRVSFADLSDKAFGFMTAQEIDVGYFNLLAMRVTFVGELGWELHVPALHAVQVYDLLMEAGADLGVRDAGMQTLGSLRLEKAYRDFGIDVDNTDNPIEAGLGFAVKLDKPGGFIGRDALAEIRAQGVPKTRMLQFLLQDPEPLLYGNELIYLNDREVGYMQIGAFGHTLGGAVGIGFAETDEPLTAETVNTGSWEVEVAGVRIPATASLKPLYDPGMEKIKR
ncbi:4-methylaminobutanoate oxidase (formaldehyde-forming) [Roseovarius litorisediminis]|uniref:4-methylaminobutanoate oxidase (Formaldehyde-forming) n=1 Tax=Roseovarius litorisediminis TaxID=1312363 RepID=A0A1Y5SVA5_9RHOB|nr:FAD-dependent oxidoreductase [Roseovarius litorisediminis]SLN49121.1 4-methylaminobutanoate oxidase (formaldehyde-forming) [Roseovarius litorisediminis]